MGSKMSATLVSTFLTYLLVVECAYALAITPPAVHSDGVVKAYKVAMRDGVELYTVLKYPIEWKVAKRPTILTRTPYGTDTIQYLIEELDFSRLGYNVVVQDFRGRVQSGGEYDMWRTAADDAADTIAWIKKQDFSDGKVFMYGLSADGVASYLALKAQDPALQGVCGIWGTSDLYGLVFQGGAIRQHLVYGWLDMIGESSVIKKSVLPHEQYGSWWAPAELTQADANAVTFPTLHQASWYDIFLQGGIDTWRMLSQGPARNQTYLVISAISMHCMNGGGKFNFPGQLTSLPPKICHATWKEQSSAVSATATSATSLPLSGTSRTSTSSFPRLAFYVMGPGLLKNIIGNYWVYADDFPTPTYTKYYLDTSGTLTTSASATSANHTYIYDPSNPVPTLGGNNYLSDCGPYDQQKIESRSDVLTFTSAPIDKAFSITGAINATLFVSTNATDTDFTVKVTDVYPDGTSMLIQDSIQRMRWRNGRGSSPAPCHPGVIYRVDMSLWMTSYVFNSGHRIRVAVSSSNTPRFSANPNNGLPLSQAGANVTAANTLFMGGENQASFVNLPIVPLSDLPPAPKDDAWFTQPDQDSSSSSSRVIRSK